MAEVGRGEGRFVTVTVTRRLAPDEATAVAETVAALCDAILEASVEVLGRLDAFSAMYGEEALLGILAPIVDRLREKQQREALEDLGRGWQ